MILTPCSASFDFVRGWRRFLVGEQEQPLLSVIHGDANPLLIQNVAVALVGRLHSPVGEALRHRDQDFLTAMMSLRLRMTTRLIDQPLFKRSGIVSRSRLATLVS